MVAQRLVTILQGQQVLCHGQVFEQYGVVQGGVANVVLVVQEALVG